MRDVGEAELLVRSVVGSAALEGAEFGPEFQRVLMDIALGVVDPDVVVAGIVDRARSLAGGALEPDV